jgi:hypothetical protein
MRTLMRSAVVLMGVAAALTAAAEGTFQNRGSLSPVIETIRGPYGKRYVEATAHADGLFQVTVKDHDGRPLFQSVYPVKKADGHYVEWTYGRNGEVFRSNRIEPGTAVTLKTMTFAAKDIVRMMSRGFEPETQDEWGCDLPDFTGVECSDRGNCCDTHDECYAAFDCSAWSWLGISNIYCEACNLAVLICVTTGEGSNGQPSACCALGNCGTERCEGAKWNDASCAAFMAGAGDPNMKLYYDPFLTDGYGLGGGMGPISGGYSISTSGGVCRFPDGTSIPCP